MSASAALISCANKRRVSVSDSSCNDEGYWNDVWGSEMLIRAGPRVLRSCFILIDKNQKSIQWWWTRIDMILEVG